MFNQRTSRSVTLVSASLAVSLFTAPVLAAEADTDQPVDRGSCVVMKDGFAWNDCGNDPYERQQPVPGAAAAGQAAKNDPVPGRPWSLSDLFGPGKETEGHPGDAFDGGDGPGR